MLFQRKSPVKVVHFEDPHHDDSTSENVDETNIVVNIVSTKSPRASPRKKRRPEATTQMLENELLAEAGRRTSMGLTILGDEDNMSNIISSLRRQNDDLRAKLQQFQGSSSSKDDTSSSLNAIDNLLMEQKEKEIEELRATVERLEKLRGLEKEERNENEKKTLELLTGVKQKWHDRENKRLEQVNHELEQAHQVINDMELELHRKQSEVDNCQTEVMNLTNVKTSLKAKLKECKTKLEITVHNYDAKLDQIKDLEAQISELETKLEKSKAETEKRRRASLVLGDKAETDRLRDEVLQLESQKDKLKRELSKSREDAESLQVRVDTLKKEKSDIQWEYDDHRARCDEQLLKLQLENSELSLKNDKLEVKVKSADKELEKKKDDLGRLEKVLADLEKKIPSKGTISAITDKKANELLTEKSKELEESASKIVELENELKLKKIEVRKAEKDFNNERERIKVWQEMYMELKRSVNKDQKETTCSAEKLEKLEREVAEEKSEKESLKESNDQLKSRLESMRKDLAELRKESVSSDKLEQELSETKEKAEKSAKEAKDFKRKYDLAKTVCDELEAQIKEYEVVIAKLEKNSEALKTTNKTLKEKSDANSEELIKAKREVNELKSTQAFKETKLKDLEEKNREIEKYYETEGATWKTKFEETVKVKKEQTANIVELKDLVSKLEVEQDGSAKDNQRLFEQNTKLKEEMTTLITSIHSLKESNLMLQTTVSELADKLTSRDKELDKRAKTIAELEDQKERMNIEHTETLNQLKKLTHHLPPNATPSKKKEKTSKTFLL